MSQQLYVSRSRALKLPNLNVRTVADPRTGRRTRVGESGGFLKPGSLIPAEVVEILKNKRESNGSDALSNLIADGTIVFEAGASSPVDVPQPLPVERTITNPDAHRRS